MSPIGKQQGWADPFSFSASRNGRMLMVRGSTWDGVYTPQMVINGAEQIVGSDRAALRARDAGRSSPAHPHISHPHSLHERGWKHVDRELLHKRRSTRSRGGSNCSPGDDSDRSSVLRGENSGQTVGSRLRRTIHPPAWPGCRPQASARCRSRFHRPFQASQRHHLILFAQAQVNGRVLGADTKPL